MSRASQEIGRLLDEAPVARGPTADGIVDSRGRRCHQLVGHEVGALHELPNQIDCFRPVSRWAETIREAGAFAPAVQHAFELFFEGKTGKVIIEQ